MSRPKEPLEALSAIRVLYRAPRTLSLYGIPYAMRPGQSPRDLRLAYETWTPPRPGAYGSPRIDLSDWIWLGQPGWWGHLSKARQIEMKTFLALHRDEIPEGPDEWSTLPPEQA